MSEWQWDICLMLLVMFSALFYGLSFFCRKQFMLLNKKLDFIISENKMTYPSESCVSAKAKTYLIEGQIEKALATVINETGCSCEEAKAYIERQNISLMKPS